MSFQNISRKSITEFLITGFDAVQRPLAIGVVMLILYIAVLISNTANIYFIFMDKRLHQPMYLFICNLAFVDMLYCSSVCPTIIGILLAGHKSISYVSCLAQMFVFHLCRVLEMFAIMIMAFDRFIAIGNPLRYHSILTNARCVLITAVLWMVAVALLVAAPATIIPLPRCESTLKYMFCDYPAIIRASCIDPAPYFNGVSLAFIILFLITFSFICLSYLNIVVVVTRMSSTSDKKKVFNTCFSHFIVIICYYAPAFITTGLTRIGVVLTLDERNGLLFGSFLGPPLVNPFVYGLRTKEIRSKLLKFLPKVGPNSETRLRT